MQQRARESIKCNGNKFVIILCVVLLPFLAELARSLSLYRCSLAITVMMIVILFTFSVFIISFFYCCCCCCCCFAKVKSLHFYILLFCFLILLFLFYFLLWQLLQFVLFLCRSNGQATVVLSLSFVNCSSFYFMCIITCASSNGLEHLLSAFLFYFCTRLRFALLCFAFLLSALAFGLSFDAALVALYWRVWLECVCVCCRRRCRCLPAGVDETDRKRQDERKSTETKKTISQTQLQAWEHTRRALVEKYVFFNKSQKKSENKSSLFQIDMKLIFVILFNWNQNETFSLSRNIWILFVYS